MPKLAVGIQVVCQSLEGMNLGMSVGRRVVDEMLLSRCGNSDLNAIFSDIMSVT